MRNFLLAVCFLSALIPSVAFASPGVLNASGCHSSLAEGYHCHNTNSLELNTRNILMGVSYGTSLVSVLLSVGALGAATTGNSDVAWGSFAFSIASEALSIGSYVYNSGGDRFGVTVPVVVSSITTLLSLIAASVAHDMRSVRRQMLSHNVRIGPSGVSFSF